VDRNFKKLIIAGTTSKFSGILHSGRQNHPQDWKWWQLLRCEENSYFLWLFFALQVCSWRLNSEAGILPHSFTAYRRSSAKINDRNLAVTQLISLPWQHSCTHRAFMHSRFPVIQHCW
jgi:hypothetical protein